MFKSADLKLSELLGIGSENDANHEEK